MSREIKFRAWIDTGMVEKGMYYQDMKDGSYTPLFSPAGYELCNPAIKVMQYTGLKDKNGMEIYEGDIVAVKFNGHYVERTYWKGKPDAIGEVYWDYSGFRLNCHGEKDTRYADFEDLLEEHAYHDGLLDMSNEHSKVIGNIYENPELLEAEL